MLSYKLLEIVGEEGWEDKIDRKSNEITHKQIENVQKVIRTHWVALNFDRGFIVSVLKTGRDFNLKLEIEIGPHKKKRGRKQQPVRKRTKTNNG
jgi:hypothetical protein